MALSELHIPFQITLANEQASYDISSSTTHTISCYTGALSEVTIALSAFADNVPSYISNNTVVWDMGDGTILKSLTSTHIYKNPGRYQVALVMYTSAGNAVSSTASQEITAYNLIDDYLKLNNEVPVFACDIAAGQSVTDAVPINVNRFNSWQSYASVSATGYTLTPYASGAVSRKRNNSTAKMNKWAHLDKTWNFFNAATADSGQVILTSTDVITSTCTSIYYRVCSFTDGFGDPQKSITRTTSAHEDAIFVGTSGQSTVYFRESQPKNYSSAEQPVIVFLSQTIQSGETLKLSIPVKVRYNHAAKLKITSNGLYTDANHDFELSKYKYVGTKVPIIVSLIGREGGTTLNYSSLSANVGITTVNKDNVVNLSLIKSDGTQLSAEWFETFDSQLPSKLTGIFRGYFIPREAADSVTLSARVQLTDATHFIKDTVYNYVLNDALSSVYRWTLADKYDSTGAKTNVVFVSGFERDDKVEYFGLAAVPVSAASFNDHNITVWVPSSADSRIYAYDTNLHPVTSINMTNAPFNINGAGSVSDLTFSHPMYVGANSEGNVWITLHSELSTVKINKSTGKIIELIAPENRYIQTAATAPTTPGFNAGSWYGPTHQVIQPVNVACDTLDNVWVTYGSPVCAFCEKYDTAGDPLSTKFEFPDNLIPHDILINAENDVYIAAGFSENGIRPLVTTVSATVTPAISGELYVYDLTSVADLSSATTNHVVIVSGMSTDYMNGSFEIDSIVNTSGTNYRIAVRPNICSLVSAASATVTAIGAVVKIYESDVVYKLNSYGTLVSTFSGFLHPSYLAIGSTKEIGIAHNWYSLTKLTSAGTRSGTQYSVTSAILKDYLGDFTGETAGQHINGVAGDLGGNFYVINGLESQMYVHNFANSTTNAYTISSGVNDATIQAWGDWNSSQYIHKYTNSSGTFYLTAAYTMDIVPASGKYHMYKFNEDFDPQETLKSYRYQEFLLNDTQYFDDLVGTHMGTLSSDPNVYGKKVYEKIANFNSNVVDIDTCNIDQLYSMSDMLNIPITDYSLSYPSNLRRVIDLTSVSKSNLFGHRSKYERDFNDYNSLNPSYATNLGTEMSVTTATLSAGQKIVARQLFNNQYTMIVCSYVSAGSAYESNANYVTIGTTKAGLSSYPLSAYSLDWNWNLDKTVEGTGISDYYRFYEHVAPVSGVQIDGLIDWSNDYTTINEDTTVEEWYDDDGVVDGIIDYEFRRGLSVFETITGATMSAVRFDYHPYWHSYDQLRPLSGAYGTRLLITGYEGPLLTILRTDTYASSSFWPINGTINSAQIASFCDTASGIVTTWFDQSSAQNNLTQSVCSLMPSIYNGDAVIVDSEGTVCLGFTTNQYLSSTTGGSYSLGFQNSNTVRSQVILFRGECDGTSDTIYTENDGSGNIVTRLNSNASAMVYEVKYSTNGSVSATLKTLSGGSVTADTAERHEFEIDNTSTIGQFTYKAGTLVDQTLATQIFFDYDIPNSTYTKGTVYLGGSLNAKYVSGGFNGKISEFGLLAGNIRDEYLDIVAYK